MSGIVGGRNNRGSGLVAHLGTDGQVLTSAGVGLKQVFEDAAGGVPDATRPAFLVTADAQTNVSGGSTTYTILWANEIFDQANNFASNAFTAPSTGRYLLTVNLRISGWDGNEDFCFLKIVTSNRNYTDSIAHTDLVSNSQRTFRLTVVADMEADDTATTTFYGAGASGDILDIDGQTGTSPVESATYFSGCLIA
jgi:hypothetical protein